MRKRIQNIVAESRHTLSVTVLYGIGVWLLAGLVTESWWIQFCCFIVSVYLMAELNNQNVLIRIFSRTVSSAYIILTCTAVWMMPSLSGAVIQLCAISSILLLFQSYQDKEAVGKTFYSFLCIGIACLTDIHAVFYLPLYWGLMGLSLYSFSIRTFSASVIGFLTPFWFSFAWYLYQGKAGILEWIDHLSGVTDIRLSIDYGVLTSYQIVFLLFLILLFVIGTIHFFHKSYNDKIRVREIYTCLIMMTVYSILLIFLQPQLYDMVIHFIIITVSPISAHFVALTYSKFTNILFFVILGIALALTGFALWTSSSLF